MSTETYTLEISETDDGRELAADLYRADRTLADSIHVAYEDHSLPDDWAAERPIDRARELATDATRVELTYERTGDAFEFRVLGDEGVLLRERP